MIDSERLILRKNTLADFEALQEMYTDPEVIRHIGTGQPSTAQETWFRLLRLIGQSPKPSLQFPAEWDQ